MLPHGINPLQVKPESAAVRRKLLRDVPPFRPVALKLLRMVEDDTRSLAEIVNLMKTDAVLTAEVMRFARSALFGPRYEIKSLLHAISHLGLNRINSLVLTVAVRSITPPVPGSFAYHCWRHNLTTALACQRLAPKAMIPADACYVAGLIHDIGRLALVRSYPHYADSMQAAADAGENLLKAEQNLFGLNHAEAGRWLLAQWGCPIELQNIACHHEAPEMERGRDHFLAVLVRACSQFADLIGMSTFRQTQTATLEEIAEPLSAAIQDELRTRHEQIAASILVAVNDMELTLL